MIKRLIRLFFEYPSLRKQELEQEQLASGYSVFRNLSGKKNIKNIEFSDASAFITLLDGRRYYFDPESKAARMYSVPKTGEFETKETEFIRKLVKSSWTCIDAGANFGWYTILLSILSGEAGSVHSFEPVKDYVKLLEENIKLNDCRNITLNNAALDEEDGESEVYVSDIGVSSSFRVHMYKSKYDTKKCATVRLDAYCSQKAVDKIDFIKADIEGAEWRMLKGGRQILEKSKPILFLEVQLKSTALFGYKPEDLFDWLAGLGYKGFYVNSDLKLVPVENTREDLPDYNFFFMTEQHMENLDVFKV